MCVYLYKQWDILYRAYKRNKNQLTITHFRELEKKKKLTDIYFGDNENDRLQEKEWKCRRKSHSLNYKC